MLKDLSLQYLQAAGYMAFLESSFYAPLKGTSKNTYKCFDILALHLSSSQEGVLGFIHPDGILGSTKANKIREILYPKYVYHFGFVNQKTLFKEIDSNKDFSLHIFAHQNSSDVNFEHIGNLYLPETIDHCFEDEKHPSEGPIPLVKDENDKWDIRGHRDRIVPIQRKELDLFAQFLNEKSKAPVFLNIHSRPLMGFIEKIALCEQDFESYLNGDCIGSRMINETEWTKKWHYPRGVLLCEAVPRNLF